MRESLYRNKNRILKGFIQTILSLILIATATGCSFSQQRGNKELVSIGHSGGNLPATLYVAQDVKGFSEKYRAERYEDDSTVAYALLSGHLDVGFVEAEKLKALSQLEGFEKLKAVGKVTYPYGATLVLRKDLNNKITDLNGLTIAVSSSNCKLLEAFEEDAKRLNADLSGVQYTTIAFDAMLPALEAGKVDGVLIKGFYSVIALKEGHKVLYQNWDVEPGDECCPAIVDQAALVLLAVESKYEEAKSLATQLEDAYAEGDEALRKAIAQNTTIPYDILTGQPVPAFSIADEEIIADFVAVDDHENDDDNHQDDDHKNE